MKSPPVGITPSSPAVPHDCGTPPAPTSGCTMAEANAVLGNLPAGESPMPHAPSLNLAGKQVVPAQYKLYRHTVATVQAVVAKIAYEPRFVIFVGKEPGPEDVGIYIQIGLIGPDNYPPSAKGLPSKIVYGRKWRVEKLLPTSELIQTVLLALKNAEEHELREQFVYRGYTPLNNHVDLPLFAAWWKDAPSPMRNTVTSVEALQAELDRVSIGGCKPTLLELEKRPSGRVVLEVRLDAVSGHPHNAVLAGKQFTVVAAGDNLSDALHGLFDACLFAMQRHVEEVFTYDGVARFSRKVGIDQVKDFVAAHRNRQNFAFDTRFLAMARALNAAIDATRPPELTPGPASDKARASLDAHPGLLGFTPKGYLPPLGG